MNRQSEMGVPHSLRPPARRGTSVRLGKGIGPSGPASDSYTPTARREADIVKVLLVEDNPGDACMIREMLAEVKHDGFSLEYAEQLSTGLGRLAEGGIDMVFLDLSLPDSRGFDTFAEMYARAPQVPIIVLAGLDDEEVAVRAVREGAQDYLVKGHVNSNLLVRAMSYAVERKRAGEKKRKLLKGSQLK